MSYLSIIQKDLPLATWSLDDTPSGSTASDYFINQDATYSTAQTVKSFPLVYGSSQSVIIDTNSGGYALKVPSLDRLSSKSKDEPFTIEFWIKFIDEGFSAPLTPTKIMGKLGSDSTGIYIHNSSIIAMVGDSAENVVKASVALPNMEKPIHIVMSYLNNSLILYVNGQASTASTASNVLTNAYNASNEFFTFIAQATELTYAIDCIAYYSRVLDIQTVRRHLAYGLGYELSNQIPARFGATRYNLSMAETKPVAVYSQNWNAPYSTNNMIDKDGYLTVKNISQPNLKYALDKDDSVFAWNANGLSVSAGGYVEIEEPLVITNGLEHGFGFIFYKPSSISGKQTLVYINNRYDSNRFLKIFFENNDLKYQLNGNAPQTLKLSVPNTADFAFGYFYSVEEQKLYVFFEGETPVFVSDSTFYPESIRLMSSPLFSDKEVYDSSDNVTSTYLKSVSHLDTIPTALTQIETLINNYKATFSHSEERFVMSAEGYYEFNIDLKRLASTNTTVGNHRVEWGYDGQELEVYATGNGATTWMAESLVDNRSSIPALIPETPGTNKYLNIKLYLTANDIEANPPKIHYFRFFTYETQEVSSQYVSNIVADGADVSIYSTSTNYCVVPPREETPFLYNEENGGLFIGNKAEIYYDYSPIDTSSVGITALSFFINPASTTVDIATIGAKSISYNGTNISGTGISSFYINGTSGTALTNNQWNHVVAVFSTSVSIPETIVFGGDDSNYRIDEIMVISGNVSSYADEIFNSYKGTYFVSVDSEDSSITIVDSEISNSNYSFSSYQPLNGEAYLLNPVSFVASSKPTTYSSPADISIDGEILSVGDRVLVTGASPGIYTVTSLVYGSSIGWSSAETLSGNSLVYVMDGAKGKGKYYSYVGSSWSESIGIPKYKVYSVDNKSVIYVDAYSSVEL